MKGIYLITDSLSILEKVIHTGIGAVQFRDKGSLDFTKVEKMRQLCAQHHVPFVVNDRVDLALLLNADGVHLGQDDFPVRKAREQLGKEVIIGVTAPTLTKIFKATDEGADYVGVGHFYPSSTKEKKGRPLTLDMLEELCRYSPLPVVAIGGIRLEHLLDMKKRGAKSVAICSAIADALSPTKTAIDMVNRWNGTHNK